jgi:invasion protein IalB
MKNAEHASRQTEYRLPVPSVAMSACQMIATHHVPVLSAMLAAILCVTAAGATTLHPSGPPAVPGLQSGESAAASKPAEPERPERTETTNFQNWEVTCQVFSEKTKKRTCSAQLRAQQAGSHRIILVWTIFINAKKQPVGVLETLTGVAIPPGVNLHLENGKQATDWKFTYQDCGPAHCHAVRILDGKFIHEATAASTAAAIMQADSGQTLRINFPIKGFGKAFAQLKPAD